MSVLMDDIFKHHIQVQSMLNDFVVHKSFEERIDLLQKYKPMVTRYFKSSCALYNFLKTTPSSNDNLKTTLRRYAKGMNNDARTIIAFYLKYGHGCEESKHFKFQVELAEAHAILTHRIETEEKYLIPAYLSLKKVNI